MMVSLDEHPEQVMRNAETLGLNLREHLDSVTIGQGGITLLPVDESVALPVLPFQSYYGLLSRAPTRLSPHLPRGAEAPSASMEEPPHS